MEKYYEVFNQEGTTIARYGDFTLTMKEDGGDITIRKDNSIKRIIDSKQPMEDIDKYINDNHQFMKAQLYYYYGKERGEQEYQEYLENIKE